MAKILDFLTEKFNKGAKYGTLNYTKAAIGNILDYSIACIEIISMFFHAINRVCPPRPKYNRTWDVNTVLKHIADWYPLETLSLEKLTKKLVILLALVTAHRAQTLVSMKLENIIRREGKI